MFFVEWRGIRKALLACFFAIGFFALFGAGDASAIASLEITISDSAVSLGIAPIATGGGVI